MQSSNRFVKATFDIEEIVIGKHLASSSACDVHDIDAFRQINYVRGQVDESNGFARDFLARQSRIGCCEESRYVIKVLREDCDDFVSAAANMAVEAEILAAVEHPNIIKLRGIPLGGVGGADSEYSTMSDSYFLVLDKVMETLQDHRIETWRKQDARLKHPALKAMIDKRGLKGRHLFLERLQAAADLASAIEHIHICNYMHRDIEPGNIGFDLRGYLKLLDFDVATKIPSAENAIIYNLEERRYDVRKLPYMSPEAFEGKEQSKSSDVYSFAIVFYLMLSLEKPFRWIDPHTFGMRIIENGERPVINTTWSPSIQHLLKRAWDPNERMRPSMMHIRQILNEELRAAMGSRLSIDLESSLCGRLDRRQSLKGTLLPSAVSKGQEPLSTTFAAKIYSKSRSTSPLRSCAKSSSPA
jgi:serine/threonine protein kinase